MDQYVGLDVSLKQTWISVRQNRKRIWRGKCLSDPRVVAEAIRQHAPNAVLVVFETLSTWFHHDLTACQRCASTHGMRRRRSTRRRTRPTRTTPVVARRGRVLPGGSGEELGGDAGADAGAPSSSASRAISPTRSS